MIHTLPMQRALNLMCIPNKMAKFTLSPEQISSLRARQRKFYMRKVFLNNSNQEGKKWFYKVLTWYYFHNLKLNKKEPKIIREGKILVNSLGWELVLALLSIFISGLKNKSLYFQKKLILHLKIYLTVQVGSK